MATTEPPDEPPPASGAKGEGSGNIAVGGSASGTFVAGIGNRVVVVGGLALAVGLLLLGLVGFGLYDHWRDQQEKQAVTDALAKASTTAVGFVEALPDTPEFKQRLRAVVGAALGTVAGAAATAGSATVAAALEDFAAGDARPTEQVLREIVERKVAEGVAKTAEGAAANREAATAARQLGALLYGRDTAGALAAYREAAELDPADTWTWIFIARLEAQAGHLGNAQAAAVKALEAARASSAHRDEMVALNELGDVRVAQGDLPGALQAFTAGKDIADKLAATDRGNTGWQRDLSVSWNKVGDVRVAQGDLPGALQAFTAGKDIRDKLAATDPGNAQWQRDLIVSLFKLAETAAAGATPNTAARY
jgi:tetratricopeptide (TPR) repeat protein